MIRLTVVFAIWMASTAHALSECATLMAQECAAELRPIGRLTDTNDRTILRDHGGGGNQR